jgi:hypothetical protein
MRNQLARTFPMSTSPRRQHRANRLPDTQVIGVWRVRTFAECVPLIR